MSRRSSIVTISLPPSLGALSAKVAKKKHMTRSELVRTALRQYLEEQGALEAIRGYRDELSMGKLKELRGSLARFVR